MNTVQPGILADIPRLSRYLTFALKPDTDPRAALAALVNIVDADSAVVGFGQSLIKALGTKIQGLRTFPAHTGPGFEVPATPTALWVWLRGDDRGELLHQSLEIKQALAPAFISNKIIDGFQYRNSRDLTGYEDGTENPEGNEAITAAIVQGRGEKLDGSSFVAVQQWVHDLAHFKSMSQQQRDHSIGRRLSDNEEIEEAPEYAHVKRTAQEDFKPEAFILRRSMPWADDKQEGLVFVAFGKSFDAFEALLRRMVGKDDGITDALFNFTHPISGSYFWCPAVRNGCLNLQVLGV